MLVEFGWLEPLPGTPRMPFTADGLDQKVSLPIGLVGLRDALSRYSNASVLVVSSDRADVTLMPLRQALQEDPDGSLMVFGVRPPID